jgi:hypothetical protein
MKYFLLALLLIFSCSKKKVVVIAGSELWKKLETAAHHTHLHLSTHSDPKDVVSCATYAPDCVSIVRGKLELVTFSLVEFKTPEAAIKEAKRLKQYSYMNWVIDDTMGEPFLENFFHHAIELK